MANYFFPQLEDEKRFETLIADIYRKQYPDAEVDEYGRRGQKQYGIDITIQYPNGNLWCIQCKNQKTFTPSDIDLLLNKCTYFQINPFERLIVATASLNDNAIINHLISVRPKYAYHIEYLPWNRICDYIEAYPDIIPQYYAPINDSMKNKFAEIIVKYGIESFTTQIDPLVEGLEMEWPTKLECCVCELQDLLSKNPLRKADTLYWKIYELADWINAYNGNLGIMLFWDGDSSGKYRYFPPYNGIDTQYEEKQTTVTNFRKHIVKLIHEIFTGQVVVEK